MLLVESYYWLEVALDTGTAVHTLESNGGGAAILTLYLQEVLAQCPSGGYFGGPGGLEIVGGGVSNNIRCQKNSLENYPWFGMKDMKR